MKLIAILTLMLMLANNAWAMSWARNTKLQKCLNAASNEATVRGEDGRATSVDDEKLLAGYCQCYTDQGNTVQMERYCN